MNATNMILVMILGFMVSYVMTDGFEAAPTALERHYEMMDKIGNTLTNMEIGQ